MSFVSVSPNSNTLSFNNSIFRFSSFNTPTLTLQDDPWQGITLAEQKDQLFSIAQLGGRVARTYVFSIPESQLDISRHIVVRSGYGTVGVKYTLNEDLMKMFDSALQLSNQLNIKLIIPIIDEYKWWGGINEFANLYGKSKTEFYTDADVRNGWKTFLAAILNRNNTLTGLQYKNDPAILAWETGNELNSPPAEWTVDTANYIKSVDSNHLIMDGSYGNWPDQVLQNSNISIVSNHYYPGLRQYLVRDIISIACSGTAFLILLIFWICRFVFPKKKWINSGGTQKAKKINWVIIFITFISFALTLFFALFPIFWRTNGIALAIEQDSAKASNKIFLVGEVGLFSSAIIQAGLDYFVNLPDSANTAGFLIWSIRGHSKDGGFYTHSETLPGYFSYHYPGFAENTGFGKDEISIISMMKQAIARMKLSGITSAPDPPVLLNVTKDSGKVSFSWFGCSGCHNYSIFLNNQTIFTGLLDNYTSGKLLTTYISDNQTAPNSTLAIQGFGDFGQTIQGLYKI